MSYLLIATVGTILFFGGYWLMMRRDTHFGMVRAYLVGSLLLSLLLPAIHLRLNMPAHFSAKNNSDEIIYNWQSTPEKTMLTAQSSNEGNISISLQQDVQGVQHITLQHKEATTRTPLWKSLLPWVWLGGCLVSAVVLLVTIVRLRRMLRRLPYKTIDSSVRLSIIDDDTPAHSFFNHIVVGRKGFSESEIEQIIGHEMVHVREYHTIDLLLCRMARVVLWFNPFVWLYERELKRLHEYIADRVMFQTDNGAQYAELFYHQVSGRIYCPICNTFDYRMTAKRIAMMAKKPSSRKSLKWMALIPLTAIILVVGCVPKNTLKGSYLVGSITLMSDNPAEPDLLCSEFLGLEEQTFNFSRDGKLQLKSQKGIGKPHHFTYTMDDNGLHIYDSNGSPWLDMTLETRHCDEDSIVLRFVDNNPVSGLSKMLRGLPNSGYKIDTVESFTEQFDDNHQWIGSVSLGKHTDTTFAHVTTLCKEGDFKKINWNDYANRLLDLNSGVNSSMVTEYTDSTGNKVTTFGKRWEFLNNELPTDARLRYDTTTYKARPRMENDRFILEIVLRNKINS